MYLTEGGVVQEKDLSIMANAMVHRGPDEEGFYVSEDRKVGLAHRRLKVIDLSGGTQPMANEDGTKILVFNGEIYNYKALRTSLIKSGHQIKSHSDTEVIVHLYEERGFQCLDALRGMFAFVLYDAKQQILFGAIDRMGKKPLYYSAKRGSFYFASTFYAITRVAEIQRDLDPVAFDDFLSLTYIPAPRTIFKGVKKLQPGHFFVWKDAQLKTKRYWEIPVGRKIDIGMSEAKALTLQKLEEAVQIRLVSDVPLGAFLSGGLDSSLVVALASRHITGTLNTFSIGFENRDYNELPFAREVSRVFNTNHHEFMVTPLEVKVLPELVKHFGEPYGDFSALPMWFLSKETRKHVTVALSGDGGDELFAGYGRHRLFLLYNMFRKAIPKEAVSFLSGRFGCPSSDKYVLRKAQRFFQIINQSPEELFADLNIFLKPWEKRFAYTDGLKGLLSASVEERMSALSKGLAGTNLDRILYTDAVTYEVCQLTKVDAMTMAWSLEGRCPLVDHELVELAFSFPDDIRMGLFGGKRVLKALGKGLLPRLALNRPKHGFTAPLKYWFREDLKTYATDRILGGKIGKIGWITKEYIEMIIQQHIRNERDFTYQVWNFLILTEWLDLFSP